MSRVWPEETAQGRPQRHAHPRWRQDRLDHHTPGDMPGEGSDTWATPPLTSPPSVPLSPCAHLMLSLNKGRWVVEDTGKHEVRECCGFGGLGLAW